MFSARGVVRRPPRRGISGKMPVAVTRALRTSRWDRRRRVYYDLLKLGPPIKEDHDEDFSDGSARLTALSGDCVGLSQKPRRPSSRLSRSAFITSGPIG